MSSTSSKVGSRFNLLGWLLVDCRHFVAGIALECKHSIVAAVNAAVAAAVDSLSNRIASALFQNSHSPTAAHPHFAEALFVDCRPDGDELANGWNHPVVAAVAVTAAIAADIMAFHQPSFDSLSN